MMRLLRRICRRRGRWVMEGIIRLMFVMSLRLGREGGRVSLKLCMGGEAGFVEIALLWLYRCICHVYTWVLYLSSNVPRGWVSFSSNVWFF